MPSRWEGFGVAALEAITLGVPAILTETSPIREVLPEGANVRVVPCEVEAIAHAIRASARDEGRSGRVPHSRPTPPAEETDMRQYARRVEEIFLRLYPSHDESNAVFPGSSLG
jgi:glycosyltransferase involved in cell wall biosynthesis